LTLYLTLKNLLLPPVGLFLLLLLGIAWWRRPLLGRGLALLSVLALLLLSLPSFATWLMAGLEPYPALTPEQLAQPEARAIVVLGAGRYTDAPEYGGDEIGPFTLQRVRYAAWLQRRTGLPLIISAGSLPGESPPLAELMQRTLENEFQVPVKAIEGRSRTTWENARFTSERLRQEGVDHIFLVSHAWHLPRAVEAFEQVGIRVTPAPTAIVYRPNGEEGGGVEDYVPNTQALMRSHYAVHEYLGRVWYALKEQLDGRRQKPAQPH